MAKKQKKQRSMMQRNKQQQLCRKLDWATSLLAVVIILAAMGTINADYDLSKSNPQGFAMWFLLLMGWIPLELFGLIRLFFGIHQDFALAGEGPTLGVCGLAAAFWFCEGEWQYVMYSGGCFDNDSYHIGYAAARSRESDLTKVQFVKHTSNGKFAPVMYKNDFEEARA